MKRISNKLQSEQHTYTYTHTQTHTEACTHRPGYTVVQNIKERKRKQRLSLSVAVTHMHKQHWKAEHRAVVIKLPMSN